MAAEISQKNIKRHKILVSEWFYYLKHNFAF